MASASRGILTVASGTLIGQLGGALAMPVLSRVYGPAEFGQYAAIAAVLVVVGSVASGKFDLAIPIPRRERDALAVAGAGVSCAVLAMSIVVAFAVMFPGAAAKVSHGESTSAWIVGSVGVLGAGGTTVLSQLAARQGRFSAMAQRNAIQPSVLAGTQVLFGLVGLGALGLVGGFALGNIFGFGSLLASAGFIGAFSRGDITRRRIASAMRRYSRFPTMMVPSGLLNAAGVQAPVILIAYIATSEAAGWYSLTQRVLSLPVALVGTATGYVYLSEASKTMRTCPSAILPLFLATSRRQLIVGVALTVGAFSLGPSVFSWVFGAQWEPAGQFARAMSLAVGAQMFAVPLSQTMSIAERQPLQLAWDVLRLLGVVGAILGVYAVTHEVLLAVWAFSVVSFIAYSVMWLLNWRTAKELAKRPVAPDDHPESDA